MSNILTDIWYKVDSIEAKIDHQHKLLHAIVDAITALTTQSSDLEKLAAAGATLQMKRDQLNAALNSVLSKQESPKEDEHFGGE